jgi:glucosamine-6-phosphate deaminase
VDADDPRRASRRVLPAGLRLQVCADAAEACRRAGALVAATLTAARAAGRAAVLGLATGRTMTAVHAELVRLHREQRLSFRDVTTFNVDEFWPLPPDDPRSFHDVMRRELFAHVDLDPARTHVPDGGLPAERLPAACADYERAIRAAGGLDLVLLGLGTNGHLAFNEPGAPADSRTRLVTLAESTCAAAGGDVPRHAVSLGLGTLLEARAIVLLAFGRAKAAVVARALQGPLSDALPASALQRHADVHVLLDPDAAADLSCG